jgi:hypothetical protein
LSVGHALRGSQRSRSFEHRERKGQHADHLERAAADGESAAEGFARRGRELRRQALADDRRVGTVGREPAGKRPRAQHVEEGAEHVAGVDFSCAAASRSVVRSGAYAARSSVDETCRRHSSNSLSLTPEAFPVGPNTFLSNHQPRGVGQRYRT